MFSGSGGIELFGFMKAPGRAFDAEDDGMIDHTVDDGRGDDRIT
jgi:hypothetical protein